MVIALRLIGVARAESAEGASVAEGLPRDATKPFYN